MPLTEYLTADYIRAGIRLTVAKSQVDKAKAEVKRSSHASASAFSSLLRAQGPGRSKTEAEVAEARYEAAERALEHAEKTLKSQKKGAAMADQSHEEALSRLKAAQKEAGPQPGTPFMFQFPEQVQDLPTSSSLGRTNSKRHKFESAVDSRRREVDEALTDYSKIEAFPSPPGRCRDPQCQANKKRHFCRCSIEKAFEQVDDLRTERRRWHARNFACSPASKRKEFQEMAKEIYDVLSERIAEEQ